jgi:glycosyltransferase involved in cell wall biosynthesis
MAQTIEHSIEATGEPVASVAAGSHPARTRIAVLSTWHPEPVDNGRKQRTRAIIEALAGEYDVALISLLAQDELDGSPLPPVYGAWQQVAVPLPAYQSRSVSGVLGGLHPYPRSLVATWNPDTALAIETIVRDVDARLVIGTDMRTFRYLLYLNAEVPGVRTVLDEPDVSPFARDADGSGPLERLRALARRRKYRRLLYATASKLDAFVVASRQEADAFASLSGRRDALTIANGVTRIPAPWKVPDTQQLLYTGSLTYGPNRDAVEYLARAILPLVRAWAPEAKLVVTGALPEQIPPVIVDSGTQLAGRLPALDPLYRVSRVFVAPIRGGTGTRVKLLEAMAIGMPVVTTSKGAEGLDVVHDTHLLLADDPVAFSEAVIAVLRDPALAARLGAEARMLVQERYNWETSAASLCQLATRLLAPAPSRGSAEAW